MNNKMISIIMPAYNEEAFISEAIESVINQNYQKYELIIINDGSTDATDQLVKKYTQSHSNKIKYINPGKVGKTKAFNIAVKESSGDWFYFMGADDLMPKDALSTWESYILDKNCNDKIALRGRVKVISNSKKYNGLILPKNKAVFNWSGPYTFFSRGMLLEFFPIPEHYPNEDSWWSLFINYFSDEKIAIDDIIMHYRIHDNNSISKKTGFSVFNEKYHVRQMIKKDFLEQNYNRLSTRTISILRRNIQIEDNRYKGFFLKILFIKSSFKNKVRAILLSNSFFYSIKKQFDQYLTGL